MLVAYIIYHIEYAYNSRNQSTILTFCEHEAITSSRVTYLNTKTLFNAIQRKLPQVYDAVAINITMVDF